MTLTDTQKRWAVWILLAVLCIAKIPAMLSADIQPWDEGMYAARVNSIHINGDFLDQSEHSVAGFETATHPPLLIWIGYLTTSIFGNSAVILKHTVFVFGLLCVLLIIKLGERLYSFEAGFLSALVFSSTYLFTVYAKRFQLDIPLVFFFLLCFYFFVRYAKGDGRKFLFWAGVVFGLALMTKSLVGIFIPMILFAYLVLKGKRDEVFGFKDLVTLTIIGIIIALPWHLYMYLKHGDIFLEYLFGFHIYTRAVEGFGDTVKPSGAFYYFSILMNNIPFGMVLLYILVKDVLSFRSFDWKKIFLWTWFLTVFAVITVFVTKIDTYFLPILPAVCIILTGWFLAKERRSSREIFFVLVLVAFNLFWFFTESVRGEIKLYFLNGGFQTMGIWAAISIGVIILLYFISRKLSGKINLNKCYAYIVILFFIGMNVYFAFNISQFEDGFKLSKIKKMSYESGRSKLVYISSNYWMNPQFTYYFDGIDVGSEGKLDYELIDLNTGIGNVKNKLDSLQTGEYVIIVDRDGINPGEEFNAEEFIPEDFKKQMKTHGYEMYLN